MHPKNEFVKLTTFLAPTIEIPPVESGSTPLYPCNPLVGKSAAEDLAKTLSQGAPHGLKAESGSPEGSPESYLNEEAHEIAGRS